MGKVLRRISLAVTLCLMLVFTMKTQVQAQTRIDTLRDGTFINLSRQDKEDTIRAIVSDAANDLGVTRTLNVGFYDSSVEEVTAYSSTIVGSESDDIMFNMYYYEDPIFANSLNKSLGYYLVETIAHEVRHSYQFQHMNDDTEYARALTSANNNYDSSGQYTESYKNNYTEVDAREYASKYADKFFGIRP